MGRVIKINRGRIRVLTIPRSKAAMKAANKPSTQITLGKR
jgi:hypothetical protein